MELKSYKKVVQYLLVTKKVLLQHELANNLIIGVCNQIANQTAPSEESQFINVFQGRQVMASAIKTPAKAVLALVTCDKEPIKLIAKHFTQHYSGLKGVVGPLHEAETFISCFPKPVQQVKGLYLYGLNETRRVLSTEGQFKQATIGHFEQLSQWAMQFYDQVGLFPPKSEETICKLIRALITSGSLFCWVKETKPVSMAAIIRQTDHISIIGLVYTPLEARGRGYAANCVKQLSEHILAKGNACGLFTDKDYPASNRIYQSIGYLQVEEFLDVGFSE
ncbi:hypothetical protein H8S90_03130 [Olivibacter sp. SDN3]|uniref:GNAT family N-acetyltransferase n=1 Tax=Olivibacter sp. SDN3 TaxID=2764720 RepID=UPI00165188F2|nr:GNAT family N-acetyltransferase [Olivibacter sp. SDN3]QNL50613.1 hypothetical protein H8S90_03130 [Olivibacter sp. SDN3]